MISSELYFIRIPQILIYGMFSIFYFLDSLQFLYRSPFDPSCLQ